MKSLRPTGGYTILEVIIVLAITGSLLLSAMTLISGQQRKTEFTTAARDFEHRIQDIFNDVETGYYASSGQLKCTNDPPAYNGPTITAANTALGTNEGCIFLGKALRFHGVGGSATKYEAYTVAGRRQLLNASLNPEDVTSLDQAQPKLFFSGTNRPHDGGTLSNGLAVSKIKFVKSYGPAVYDDIYEGIAVLSGISAKDANGLTIASADNRAYLASVKLVAGSPAFTDRFDDFSNIVKTGSIGMEAYPSGTVICLNDGPGGRVAAVGVGVRLDASNNPQPTGNRLATELFLDDNASVFGCTS